MKNVYLIAVLLLASRVAVAQSDPGDYWPTGPYHRPVPPWPVEMGFSQHHASTAAEGFARGQAAVIQALGNYWLSRSQGAILAEQARWANLDSDRLRCELRAWKHTRREANLERKRRRNEAARLEKYRDADELAPDQLDRATGAILWPEALRADRFDGSRHRVEELFRAQACYSSPPSVDVLQMEREVQSLIRSLERSRNEVARNEYVVAQKFLRGMKYEPLFRSQVF